MEDKEIYRGKEDWDLSPDERVTLNRETDSLYGKGKEKREEKRNEEEKKPLQTREKETLKKRFLSKSMAFFASAAVITGVISGAGSGHSPGGAAVGEDYVCPVCKTVNCEFWDNKVNMEVYTLSGNGTGQYEVNGGNYGVDTLAYDTVNIRICTEGILMPDGRRAMLIAGTSSISNGFYRNSALLSGEHGNSTHYLMETDLAVYPQTDVAIQAVYNNFTVHLDSDQGPTDYDGMIQLLYSPDGKEPDVWAYTDDWSSNNKIDFAKELKYAAVRQVEGESCLWIRSYSGYSQEAADTALETSSVKIWKSGNEFALGSNLRFTETDRIRLTGEVHPTNSNKWRGTNYICYIHWQDPGHRYSGVRLNDKGRYSFFYIYAERCSFDDICTHTEETRRLAEERGHKVPALLKKLDRITVNGIGYTVYLYASSRNAASSVDVEKIPELELFFSPDTDPNIAVKGSIHSLFQDIVTFADIDKMTSLKETDLYRSRGYSSVEEMLEKENSHLMEAIKCIEMR